MSCLFVAFSMNAQTTFKKGVFSYTVTGPQSVELSDADSKDASGMAISEYVIPQTVENEGVDYTVTAIGEDVFYWSNLTSVVIPNTVTAIKSGAFKSTSKLTSVTLPEGLETIGDYAFNSSGLNSIVIPSSVKEIGASAFFTCKSLKQIDLGTGLEKIGPSAFYKCPFTSIVLPAGVDVIPTALFYGCDKLSSVTMSDNVSSIGDRAFRECKSLESITLPDGVKSIGNDCFLLCDKLTHFRLPASLENMGVNVIANTSVSTLEIAPGNKHFTLVDGVVYAADKSILYLAPIKGLTELKVVAGCRGISGGAFSAADIRKITLPDGFLAIDGYAFCESALEEIDFQSSVVFLGEQSFAGTNLTTVTLPENMPNLYSATFAQCKSLTNVIIPSGVKYICQRAFYGCGNLQSVSCLGSEAPELEEIYEAYEGQFYGVDKSCKLYVPNGSSASYREKGWHQYLTITETENGVLKPVSTTPADGSVVAPGWLNMAFDITFSEPITIVNTAPEAYLRVGSEISGVLKTPDNGWVAVKENANTLRVWGSDYDGFPCIYKAEDGKSYFMIIPAGVVKNAAGDANEQIVISVKCEQTNDIESIGGGEDAVEVARYAIGGQKIPSASKGINIVRMSDGSVKKVLVK